MSEARAWRSPGCRPAWLATALLAVGFAGLVAGALAAAEPATEAADPPPEELAPEVRGVLQEAGVRLEAQGVPMEIWLRREPALLGGARAPLGVAYSRLQPGSLVGALLLAGSWRDYHGQELSPGVYTLRYLVQPDDGYHGGVSLYRDFLVLAPAEEDRDPEGIAEVDGLIAMSRKASGTQHPAVLALFPAPHGVEVAEGAMNELEQPLLLVPCGPLTLALAVAGQGESGGF